MLYEISNSMKDISVKSNDPKNNLPIGTVLRLNGYDYHCYPKHI